MLGLLSDVAGKRPLVCLVDDQQWLDRASAQVLAFVARRLEAESVGLVFAVREAGEELGGLPELIVEGLRDGDARALLNSVFAGPVDARVRDRIVSEARGNPLALLELPRGLTPAELAGGFGLPGAISLPGRLEESFQRQLDALPAETRRLVQLAAADPVGDPVLVWRAAERLGIGAGAITAAAEAGLLEFGTQVRLRHPLVRSMAYRSASLQDRREVHRALAEVTDPQVDPDRRAWHRAQAAPGPDEDVAAELERSASRAQARGGMAAAAAFLEQAALLTREPVRRAQRLLAAAQAKRDAGALDAALGLLVAAEKSRVPGRGRRCRSPRQNACAGRSPLTSSRGTDAARLLLSAARRLEPLDPELAREAHLEALVGRLLSVRRDAPGAVSEAARGRARGRAGPDPPRPVDVLLDAFALRLAGTRAGGQAAPEPGRWNCVLARGRGHRRSCRWAVLPPGTASAVIAASNYGTRVLARADDRQARLARGAGALVHLQFALNYLARAHLLAGELTTAALMLEEDHLIAEATGNPPVADTEVMLAAWRGQGTGGL